MCLCRHIYMHIIYVYIYVGVYCLYFICIYILGIFLGSRKWALHHEGIYTPHIYTYMYAYNEARNIFCMREKRIRLPSLQSREE